MWTEGYYQSIGFQIPETASVTITNITFDPQNPTFFNVTVLNPSFSPSNVNITKIMVSTEDGVFHNVWGVRPSLPGELRISMSKTFKCVWNWADYTGQDIIVHVFVSDGTGSNLEKAAPLVKLAITDMVFNSTISENSFNVTVRNFALSAADVDVSRITVSANGTIREINVTNPELPYVLNKNSTVTFVCSWNWTAYQGMITEVTVYTLQHFKTSKTITIPKE